MAVYWPADLPQRFQVEGYREQEAETRVQTPMDAGPPKVRRMWSAQAAPIDLSLKVQEIQRARFRTFWRDDTKQGSLSFYAPHPSLEAMNIYVGNNDPVTLPDAPAHVLGDHWQLMRFGSPSPSYTALGGLWWQINFQLLVLP
jgi:hypothetical protein